MISSSSSSSAAATTTLPETEGELVRDVPGAGKECRTWYKVVGTLSPSSAAPPVIVIHGGPGACHEYLLGHTRLTERLGAATVHYDQLGNGRSTHLREKMGDEGFWTEALFRDELDALVDHLRLREHPLGFDVVGHSWGGMLASAYATYRPKGLRRLVVFSGPADMRLWAKAGQELLAKLPQDVQDTIHRCEREGKTDTEEYEQAMAVFYKRHLSRKEPWPAKEVEVGLGHLQDDPTTYATMNGPSEIKVVGSLRDWQVTDRLHSVEVPVLVVNGEYDECQDSTVLPFFQKLDKVKWVVIPDAAHFIHVDQPERYYKVVEDFLTA